MFGFALRITRYEGFHCIANCQHRAEPNNYSLPTSSRIFRGLHENVMNNHSCKFSTAKLLLAPTCEMLKKHWNERQRSRTHMRGAQIV